MILAISAILAANMSAQEVKARKGECKKEKKECKLSPEQRVEMDIKYLSEELYLDSAQTEKFAKTYREFVAEKQKLNERFKAKFAKDLNEKQVRAVLRYHGPKHKGEFKPGEQPRRKGDFQPEQGKKLDHKAKREEKKD